LEQVSAVGDLEREHGKVSLWIDAVVHRWQQIDDVRSESSVWCKSRRHKIDICPITLTVPRLASRPIRTLETDIDVTPARQCPSTEENLNKQVITFST
jgi:hypothetical protein